eukprot:919174_1
MVRMVNRYRFLEDSRVARKGQCDSSNRLVDAVEIEDIAAIRNLLSNSETDVNQSDFRGRTALYVAVRKGNMEIVQLILENPNVDVNKASTSGITPLYSAIYDGHTEIVRMLDAETARRHSETATILLDVWPTRVPVDIINKVSKYV